MLKSIKTLVLSFTLLASPVIIAAPNYIELNSSPYTNTVSQCKNDSVAALKSAGFKPKGAEFEDQDSVGTQGDYKAVVSCINIDVDRILFIVSGPNYKIVTKKLDLLTNAL